VTADGRRAPDPALAWRPGAAEASRLRGAASRRAAAASAPDSVG